VILTKNYVYDYNFEELNKLIDIPIIYHESDFCWQNREYIIKHYKEYDYIIESDDDIKISYNNILYYIKNECLDLNYIPGFIVVEYEENNIYIISMHLKYPLHIKQKLLLHNKLFIVPQNVHSACYIIDKNRLEILIKNKQFTKEIHSISPYDSQCTSRSDIYLGMFKKIIDINEIKNCLVHHLSNKYIKLDNDMFPRDGYRSIEFWKQYFTTYGIINT
jgi:hypothetical protein